MTSSNLITLAQIAEARPPSEAEREMAARILAAILDRVSTGEPVALQLGTGTEPGLSLPAAAVKILTDALAILARGEAVVVAEAPQELSSGQAADLLDISFDCLASLCNRGEISSRIENGHRRIRVADMIAWEDERKARRLRSEAERRRRVLDDLAAHGQALGFC
jgi:hypothetical protein